MRKGSWRKNITSISADRTTVSICVPRNTTIFLQLAEGLDDETWEFHLRRGDYSEWFRQTIKDPELADEVAAVERDVSLRQRKAARASKKRSTADIQPPPKPPRNNALTVMARKACPALDAGADHDTFVEHGLTVNAPRCYGPLHQN
jgi:hypothetical protein